MKKALINFVIGLICLSSTSLFSQGNFNGNNNFQISLRAGYDFPTYLNGTPYIDYKGGFEAGVSFDYYWNWLGLGADIDFIRNKPSNIYPTTNLFDQNFGVLLTKFDLKKEKIMRLFYGIGPSFRYKFSNKFSTELNARVGLTYIKGGRTELTELTTGTKQILNFHAGYNDKFVFSLKGQAKLNYDFNNRIGMHIGAYYLQHFNAEELSESGISASYKPLEIIDEMNIIKQGDPALRLEPCKCNIHSIGVFAGVNFRFGKKTPKEEAKCLTCEKYNLAVTAKDKYTDEVLPNTDIAVKDIHGKIIRTGTTNSYGVVVFDDIAPQDYTIEGILYEVALESSSTKANEFIPNETLYKEVLYADLNFILKGNAVVCNTNTPISGVSVVLKNIAAAEQKNTVTGSNGEFVFHLNQQATYTIYGKKEKYFSQHETVSTKEYDRSTTLFVKLEICLEEADCGTAIALKNIHYDLNKYFIRDDAKPELNRLVQFMNDNPMVSVEISSHTDSRASDNYNLTLSQNRATAAVNYLISQGISGDRLIGIGYGESRLLNECADGVKCSEAKHQLNRRTEMKVVCP